MYPEQEQPVNHAANITDSATGSLEHAKAMIDVANDAEGAIEQAEIDPIEAALMELYAQEDAEEEEANADDGADDSDYDDTDDADDGSSADDEDADAPLNEWQQRALAAEAALIEQSVFSAVGGEEEYGKLIQWAGQNLTPAQQALYDDVIESGTQEQVMFAVNGLRAMAQVAGMSVAPAGMREGNLLRGRATVPDNGAFASEAEAYASMENPLYFEDSSRGEAYRRQVASRMAKSGSW